MDLDRVTGVFVGEWEDGQLYAVLYGEGGDEYLLRCEGGFVGWKIVSVKAPDGTETAIAHPPEAPSPLVIATELITNFLMDDNDEDIVI